MKTIRYNTFETNSSSTHALVILTKQDYENWQNDKVALDLYKGSVVPINTDIIKTKEGKIIYNGNTYADIDEFMEEEYDVIDDDYATKEYIDKYADVEMKELNDKIILSIYREERW